jgi:hypothetical protein
VSQDVIQSSVESDTAAAARAEAKVRDAATKAEAKAHLAVRHQLKGKPWWQRLAYYGPDDLDISELDVRQAIEEAVAVTGTVTAFHLTVGRTIWRWAPDTGAVARPGRVGLEELLKVVSECPLVFEESDGHQYIVEFERSPSLI